MVHLINKNNLTVITNAINVAAYLTRYPTSP
jgi:DeoR/GlpR family transcriptional regulator of sugar metabolism